MARRHRGHPPQPPLIEWVVAAAGAIVVVGVLAFLVSRALNREPSPPDIRIMAGEVTASTDGFLLQFVVRNSGIESAEGVVVEGRLLAGGGAEERAQTTIDYVPGGSEVGGGLFFRGDPREGTLELRALGYERP